MDSDDDSDVWLRRRRGGGVGTKHRVVSAGDVDNVGVDIFDVFSADVRPIGDVLVVGNGGIFSHRCRLAVFSHPGVDILKLFFEIR
jgi:hypothetical protein